MRVKLKGKGILVENNGVGGHTEAEKQLYLSNGEKTGFVGAKI